MLRTRTARVLRDKVINLLELGHCTVEDEIVVPMLELCGFIVHLLVGLYGFDSGGDRDENSLNVDNFDHSACSLADAVVNVVATRVGC
jgi:hypothetical protein